MHVKTKFAGLKPCLRIQSYFFNRTGNMKGLEQIAGLDVIFDLSPEMLCLLDEGGHFLMVNKFLSRALGYSEVELLSKPFLDFLHPEDKENSLKQIEALRQNKTVHLFKNRYRCANGLYKSFSWNVTQFPDKTFYASAREITQYLNVKNQLAKAITNNQKFYDNSLDMICVFDTEGCFTKVSKAAKTILGYDEQELLGINFLDFVYPEDVASTISAYNEIKFGNSKTNFENRYIHKNGSIVPLIWSAQYLPFEQACFATARDATEREKQKEQLHFNQRRLEALVESGNDLIGIINTDGVYIYVSSSFQKIFGIAPETFIGKTPFDFIHPDDVNRLKKAFEYILTTEDTVHVPPFRMINGEGSCCWIETFAINKANDPAIGGVVVNSRDISIKIKDEEEKRLAAEKLMISNERYKLVTKATQDIIWDWDLETNELSRDKSFEKILGFPFDATTVNSASWEAYIHPEDKERVIKSIIAATDNSNEHFWKEEYRFIKPDGSVAFIIDEGYVVRNAAKKAVRMVGAMHDNTEIKEKELQILKQNEQLREIAQINSHVIRRPVATILGLMDLLDKNCVSGEENLEILEHLTTTTKELDEVIRQVNNKTF